MSRSIEDDYIIRKVEIQELMEPYMIHVEKEEHKDKKQRWKFRCKHPGCHINHPWDALSLLIRHFMACHLGEPEFPCQIEGCSYGGQSTAALRIHYREVHLELRTYQCPRCEYTAKDSSTLGQHIHRQEEHDSGLDVGKTFGVARISSSKCCLCGFTAFKKEAIRRHCDSHWVLTENNKYVCPYGGCGWERECDLTRWSTHVIIHHEKDPSLCKALKGCQKKATGLRGLYQEHEGGSKNESIEAILAKKPDCLLREAMKNGTAVFLDTEFIILDSGTCLPLEIAILDHEGTTIANTEIDHRVPVNKLDGMAKRDALINSLVINKIYGKSLGTFGKSPRQLAKAQIEAGINKDSVFIEWSTNGCDFKNAEGAGGR